MQWVDVLRTVSSYEEGLNEMTKVWAILDCFWIYWKINVACLAYDVFWFSNIGNPKFLLKELTKQQWLSFSCLSETDYRCLYSCVKHYVGFFSSNNEFFCCGSLHQVQTQSDLRMRKWHQYECQDWISNSVGPVNTNKFLIQIPKHTEALMMPLRTFKVVRYKTDIFQTHITKITWS